MRTAIPSGASWAATRGASAAETRNGLHRLQRARLSDDPPLVWRARPAAQALPAAGAASRLRCPTAALAVAAGPLQSSSAAGIAVAANRLAGSSREAPLRACRRGRVEPARSFPGRVRGAGPLHSSLRHVRRARCRWRACRPVCGGRSCPRGCEHDADRAARLLWRLHHNGRHGDARLVPLRGSGGVRDGHRHGDGTDGGPDGRDSQVAIQLVRVPRRGLLQDCRRPPRLRRGREASPPHHRGRGDPRGRRARGRHRRKQVGPVGCAGEARHRLHGRRRRCLSRRRALHQARPARADGREHRLLVQRRRQAGLHRLHRDKPRHVQDVVASRRGVVPADGRQGGAPSLALPAGGVRKGDRRRSDPGDAEQHGPGRLLVGALRCGGGALAAATLVTALAANRNPRRRPQPSRRPT